LDTKRIRGDAKFSVGQIVRHRLYPFRGVIFDVDPVFNNTEEWYQSIPADRRPAKEQPFYHLLAQNAQGGPYEAYVSEQNLLPDADPASDDRCGVRTPRRRPLRAARRPSAVSVLRGYFPRQVKTAETA
jgi:hemimethylated DNA binding protein